jgi:osmoprotectant transport system ATP-binding protein
VARALAADPPVLLMDEPFSAVDPIVRSSLQDELVRLPAGLRKTVVLVTHDVEEAIKVGDLVAVYRPGARTPPGAGAMRHPQSMETTRAPSHDPSVPAGRLPGVSAA